MGISATRGSPDCVRSPETAQPLLPPSIAPRASTCRAAAANSSTARVTSPSQVRPGGTVSRCPGVYPGVRSAMFSGPMAAANCASHSLLWNPPSAELRTL